jgi:hypothetical protein
MFYKHFVVTTLRQVLISTTKNLFGERWEREDALRPLVSTLLGEV